MSEAKVNLQDIVSANLTKSDKIRALELYDIIHDNDRLLPMEIMSYQKELFNLIKSQVDNKDDLQMKRILNL